MSRGIAGLQGYQEGGSTKRIEDQRAWKEYLKNTQEVRKVGPYNPNLGLNRMKAAIRRGAMRAPYPIYQNEGGRWLIDEDTVEELADHVTKLYSQEGGDIDFLYKNVDDYVPGHLREAFEKAVISIEGTTPFIRERIKSAKRMARRGLGALALTSLSAAGSPLDLAAEFAFNPDEMGSGTPDWRRSEGLQDRPFGEDIYRSPEELEASGRYRATQFEQLEDLLPYTGTRLPTGRRVGPVRPR